MDKFSISIHALREEGDFQVLRKNFNRSISIHALREEGDPVLPEQSVRHEISIHALREEGDQNGQYRADHRTNFYPRPPRGGRRIALRACAVRAHFYPRPPRGGRPGAYIQLVTTVGFLSTPSARRATPACISSHSGQQISIHALREEGDGLLHKGQPPCSNFYPRPPRGGRLALFTIHTSSPEISIHALREEGDSKNRDKISIFKQIIQHSARI